MAQRPVFSPLLYLQLFDNAHHSFFLLYSVGIKKEYIKIKVKAFIKCVVRLLLYLKFTLYM